MLANKQREEISLAQEIAEQRCGVLVGVVKVPVTVIERWEEMARELEGLHDLASGDSEKRGNAARPN